MKLLRRQFLYLAAGAGALPAASHIAPAQYYPSPPAHWIVLRRAAPTTSWRASSANSCRIIWDSDLSLRTGFGVSVR
jgi:hypothetical protein